MPDRAYSAGLNAIRSPLTHRVVIVHTAEPSEALDFCRGVASYRPRSGVWGLWSIPMESHSSLPYLRRLGQTPCHGMIMMPGKWRTLMPPHERGVQVVDVDGDGDSMPYAKIRLDHQHIGRLAGEHLLERGFKRIVYLGEGSKWSRERAGALQIVVKGAGAEFQRVVADDWIQLCSPQWIIRQLRRIERPFAVMGCNDVVAACVVRAANAAKWQVPTEVGVIGVDDQITECIGVQPPLSSISIERFRIGQEAARMLDRLFLGTTDARKVRPFKPQGVSERESTSTYVYADPDVAAAVAFIRREACNGITIDEVVRRNNLTRRTLERRFAQIVGRSPGDEIRQVRMDAVKHAIAHTQLPLTDIAARSGFSGISALSHSFRKDTGMSPREYRRRNRARVEEE